MGKPAFHSIVDLGLRDVGVVNQPRRLAVHLGKWSVPAAAAALALSVGTCMLAGSAGAGTVAVVAVALAWPAVVLGMALRIAGRSPVAVVKVTGEREMSDEEFAQNAIIGSDPGHHVERLRELEQLGATVIVLQNNSGGAGGSSINAIEVYGEQVLPALRGARV